jgi:hypothetical protein
MVTGRSGSFRIDSAGVTDVTEAADPQPVSIQIHLSAPVCLPGGRSTRPGRYHAVLPPVPAILQTVPPDFLLPAGLPNTHTASLEDKTPAWAEKRCGMASLFP